jgi:putative transposase
MDMQQLCEWKKLEVLEMNVKEDHVHVVLSIPLKFSVSKVVGFLKGKCAIKIFDKHLELKNDTRVDTFGTQGTVLARFALMKKKFVIV